MLKLSEEGVVEHRCHHVWWGAAGASNRAAPILTVHGGPGIAHDCLEPLADQAVGRRVIFYDQYGCGRSARASDPSDYGVDLFVDELATMRGALGLEKFHLFAHSYGGPLALEYLLSREPTGVLSLVLSNTFPSIRSLAAGWAERIAELPPEMKLALADGPVTGSEEAYGDAMGEFVRRYVIAPPFPEPLLRSQEHSGAEVYARMHGSSWLHPDGLWSNWDVRDRLAQLRVPTLVIGGTRDQCVPALARALHEGIAGSKLAILDTAHLPFFENPHQYHRLLHDFFNAVETA